VLVAVLRERRPAPEILPEGVEGSVVPIAQHASRLAELGQVAGLEEGIAGMGRQSPPEVGAQHGDDHRAVAAAGLALDPAMVPIGDRAVALVHERHDLVAEVGEVVARAGRVQELAAAERRPAVHPDHDHRRCSPSREEVVGELREVPPER
jgi:hypothetical protein